MSSVKIEDIQLQTDEGPVIIVSGIDMMNGTPIYDKPVSDPGPIPPAVLLVYPTEKASEIPKHMTLSACNP